MINSHCRKFLKFLRNSAPDFDDRVFTYSWIEENFNEPLESVFAMVRYLDKQGYIEVAKSNGTHFGVILTEPALHPHQFSIDFSLLRFLPLSSYLSLQPY